ncbi:kinesin-like protein KIF14 isoform X3 [Venturia canescens]|uniref:kinesin-like protein KIF14 isoform X3 n=1 Tax=Venturia canescens TaxID=32260 RepID=UPI001C9C491E|nr:kinesin-like protein KIF14 isoform X3 [Venturia canescens]
MSERGTTHVNIHGSWNAIFSSSPFHSDKENRPAEKSIHESYSELKSNGKSKEPLRPMKETNWFAERVNTFERVMNSQAHGSSSPMTRSKSSSTLQRENSGLYSKSDDRMKTPLKSGSKSSSTVDKTPVTHFCTPRGIGSSRQNGNSRTPLKRYFSDHVLSQATPECFNAVHMETPKGKQDATGVEEQTVCEGENSNLTVGVRVRPLSFKELNDSKVVSIVQVKGQNLSVNCDSSEHTFAYDHCFVSYADPETPGHASQETVFRTMVLPLVQNAFEGYNVCLFAYGQTGSGKSHSMMGTESSLTSSNKLNGEAGIIPRFCHEIFSRSSKNRDSTTSVEISYFEIYNEKIHDLLASNSVAGAKRAPLKVREHPEFGPYVVDLSQHSVQNYNDLQTWLQVGNSQRATAATGMNEKSSRSHSIFSIILTQTPNGPKNDRQIVELSRRSKINLVDLAGSERLSHTCASGERLKEGVSINKSLLILGKVIASLAESTNNKKRGFIPYRESVLTWLLKESLGGNSRTAMLGTVSPGNIHLEETLATLRYACQARAIVNRVRINEDPHDKLIRELKAEVLRLRGVREVYEKQLGPQPRRILNSEKMANDNAEEVQKKQREIDELKDQLRRAEQQLSSTQNTIENNNGSLTLTPEAEADTYLNGQMVNGRVRLNHGDRLVIGGNHYFKVCLPHGDQNNKQITAQPVDFEFAHQEISTIQEEKLRAELEESKQKAIKELENAKREIEAQLNAQKCSYEQEIQALGTSLEKQKRALEKTNRQKRELEIEKDLLASEVERNNRMKELITNNSRIQVTPYKSNFLEELEAVLCESTEVESALRMKSSNEAIKAGGVSLHEMQLLVREATERCRDVGVNYEFYQQQMVIDKELRSVVRVRDRDSGLETHWEPLHFLDWVHRLRDHDIEDSIRELRNSEDNWEAYEDSDIIEDSLNNSRISINMAPMKKQLNESLHHLSLDNSMLERTEANETTESTLEKRRSDIAKYLEEMENAAKSLSRLCHEYETRETSGRVTKSMDKVYNIIDDLKNILNVKNNETNNENDGSDISEINNTVIENSESVVSEKNANSERVPINKYSPIKSNNRDVCPFFKDPPNSKSVRFDVK